jgi:hypothetical protein
MHKNIFKIQHWNAEPEMCGCIAVDTFKLRLNRLSICRMNPLLRHVTNGLRFNWSSATGEELSISGEPFKSEARFVLCFNCFFSVLQLDWVPADVTPRVSKPHDYVNHMFMRL